MYQVKKTHRLIALFFVMSILLPCITPYGNLRANNNGPDAPEAASFEPVDATDMVNLLTGDFSYVLPIMNVPSPEGGYPIALAYHGGIAMDLQSSWVGLGWNLNPGAINRSVNGYPDDYLGSQLTDYFYDSGGTEVSYGVSLGYSSFEGYSIGVGYNWGSHQSSSGYVSVGIGPEIGIGDLGLNAKIGFNQPSSVGIGFKAGGLSYGISASTDGSLSGSIGGNFDSNTAGFSIGASTNGTYSAGVSSYNDTGNGYSLGMTFSSEGVGLTAGLIRTGGSKNLSASGSIGIGAHTAFNTTVSQGDYTLNQSGFTIPIIIPTPIGIFSFSFGKRKVVYFSAKKTKTSVTGPLNFDNASNSNTFYTIDCHGNNIFKFYDLKEAEERFKKGLYNIAGCTIELATTDEAFMDIYEIPLSNETNTLSNNYDITYNNPVFPAYDKYQVQAQGLSGSIHATLVDNGRLFGLSKKTEDNALLEYEYNGLGLASDQVELPPALDFRSRPEFYFDNEISSYLSAPKANFKSLDQALSVASLKEVFHRLSGNELDTNRFKKSNYIEYATNRELLTNIPQDLGFLMPETPLDRANLPQDGIGAYKITAADGKTYHYALPVYNHETVTRTFGIVNERPEEKKSYLEKRQLEAYATHWLLTAVTGADYVDNGDGIAGEGDLGYWVNFDYGLWSDAYVWSPHPDKRYVEDIGDNTIKTWIKGCKQVYYLDKINTRTHTAVFIKSENKSDSSLKWDYRSVAHNGSRDFNYIRRFNIEPHNGLKLDRILLLKNEDFALKKYGGTNLSLSTNVHFNDSNKASRRAAYRLTHNVYNDDFVITEQVPFERDYITKKASDNWKALRAKALKEVVFEQNYSLSNEQLSLQSVSFKGKKGANVMPPYRFSYEEDAQYQYNKEDANDWGYYKNNLALWSLKDIITPQGGSIQVNYEPHHVKVVKSQEYTINSVNFKKGSTYTYEIDNIFGFKIGAQLDVQIGFATNFYQAPITNRDPITNQLLYYLTYDFISYKGKGVIENITRIGGEKQKLIVKLLGTPKVTEMKNERSPAHANEYNTYLEAYNKITFNTNHKDLTIRNTGVRVKNITTTDGIQKYSSSYTYGENEDGKGWITYSPHAPDAQEDVPYSTELPPSRPMYEYVTHTATDTKGNSTGKVTYHFNVLNDKSPNKIKYGNFYELNKTRDDSKTSDEKEVSIKEYVIHDNLSSIGQLLSVSTYNSEDQLLSKLSNTYCSPEDLPDNMGIVQESYQSYKNIAKNKYFNSEKNHWMVNSSTRIKYPSLLKSSTESRNGVSYTTTFSDFDLVSGQAKQTHSQSSLGLELKTESEPAFYHYPNMGSKADDIDNKNMLSQGAQTLSYFRKKPTAIWELYGAEVETWKKWNHNIWRKYQTYAWNGDLNDNGSYKNFKPFKWNTSVQDKKWQRIAQITKYSDYSEALETMDINGSRASKKLGDNQSKVMAVSNTSYGSTSYANFEYPNRLKERLDKIYTEDDILLDAGRIVANRAHTGKYAIKTPSNSVAFSKSLGFTGGVYKASVWVHKTNYKNTVLTVYDKIINYNPEQVIEAGDWVQLNFTIELDGNWAVVGIKTKSGEAYYDDFRLHPVASSMTTYVYNEWDELTHILGANNMATKYEYDAAGKLHKTFTEVPKNASTDGGFKLINKTNYNYQNQ